MVIDQFVPTLFETIENASKEDQILLDQFDEEQHRNQLWFLTTPKIIENFIWTEQIRQRIHQREDLLKFDRFSQNQSSQLLIQQFLKREENLEKKLNELIEKLNRQWIDRFRQDDLLHLNEPLLRKENEYYVVNMKIEVICSILNFLDTLSFV